ncbi:MAG: hypothetical protein JRI76_06915 [Deltaproteobacteria bacterium]|nr:hypothetical protein [Deltaproteobacteria bacterium]MBW2041751.1 hypothetical protein [Deltaproteobacteria bacterium]
MKRRGMQTGLIGVLASALLIFLSPLTIWGLTADHHAPSAFSDIPASYFSQVRLAYHIFYGHTSHGSQIVTGLQMLNAQNPTSYAVPVIQEYDWTDLGDPDWASITRGFLSSNPQTNVVMWSWCGQLSWLTASEVDAYLAQMSRLEQEFPGVVFVYMTGHLDGEGPLGTLYANNERIRSYCAANHKVLFDFADIERFDPQGTGYPYGTDRCEWCEAWCATRVCPTCEDCAHSHCFNCYQKGKAFWWMMANIAGWLPPG